MKISRWVGFVVLICSLGGTQAIQAFSFKEETTETVQSIGEVPVNSSVQAPRNLDIQTEEESDVYQLPDDLPNVFLNQELIDSAKERLSQSPDKYPLTHKAYQDIQARAKNFYDNVSLSKVPVYTGTKRDEYRPLVENGLAQTLYPAIICAFEDKQEYCQKAIDFILAWAEKKGGVRLGDGKNNTHSDSGLDISRYFFRYAQAFYLVSPYLSETEKKMVRKWFLELGYQIKKSHKYWIENLEREGANSHLSWHNEGMIIAALYGEDRSLLAYLMNGNRWSYKNLVRDSIYEQNNSNNLFRANRDFSHLPIQTRTGEMYDRHRSLPHPPANEDIYNRQKWWNEKVRQRAGFAYSKSHLGALMLTAHIAQLNSIDYSNNQRFMDLHNKSIRNALRFYGRYYIDFPSGRSDCRQISEMEPSQKPYDSQCPIAYEPYFGERPSYQTIYLFTLAKDYYPEDKAFYEKILSANRKELIPVTSYHPQHVPASVFTFFFAEK